MANENMMPFENSYQACSCNKHSLINACLCLFSDFQDVVLHLMATLQGQISGVKVTFVNILIRLIRYQCSYKVLFLNISKKNMYGWYSGG